MFTDSKATTDSEWLAQHLKKLGLTVEVSNAKNEEKKYDVKCPDPDGCEDALRAEAAALGLKPHWNAKTETIRLMIEDHKKKMSEAV